MSGASAGLTAPQGLESAAMRAIREGLSRSTLHTPAEAPASDTNNLLSQEYWRSSCLSYDDILVDGFYELFGEFPDATTHPDDFPELERLARLTASPRRRRGVVLLDRRLDPGLESIVEDARAAVEAARTMSPGSTLAAHRALAQLVAGHLGGPQAMTSPSDRWIDAAQSHTTGVIFLISGMYLGGARHRAILYKFLADQLSLPARVVKGRFFADGDDDARLIIPLDGKDMHLDLMARPGATSALEDKLALRASNRDSGNLRAAAGIELAGFGTSTATAPPTPALAGIAEIAAVGSSLEPFNSTVSQTSVIAKTSGIDVAVEGGGGAAAPVAAPVAAHNDAQLGAWISHMKGGLGGQPQEQLSMEQAMQLAASAALAAPTEPPAAAGAQDTSPIAPQVVASSPPMAIVGGNSVRTSDNAYSNLPPSPYSTAPLPPSFYSSPRVSAQSFGSHPANASLNADRNSFGGRRSDMAHRLSIGNRENPDFQSEFQEMGPPALVSDASGQQYMIQPVRASLDIGSDSMLGHYGGTAGRSSLSAAERLSNSAVSTQKPPSLNNAVSGGGGGGGGGGMVDVTILPSNASIAASIGASFRGGGGAHTDSMLQWAAMQAAGAGTAGNAPSLGTDSLSSLEGAALQNALSGGRQFSLETSLPAGGDSIDLSKLYLDGLIHHGSVRMSVPLEFEQRQALLSRTSGSEDQSNGRSSPPLADAKQGSRSSGGGVPFPLPEPTPGIFSPFSTVQRPLTSSSAELGSSPGSSEYALRAASGVIDTLDKVPEMRPSSAMSPREYKRHHHHHQHRSHGVELNDRTSLSSSVASRGISLTSLNDSISALEEASGWEIDPEELQFGPRIGVGSYGEVYRGQWRQTDVAIKRFLDQDVSTRVIESFSEEVSIMKRLRHPNIVQFMGACTRPPNLMLVIEYVPRGSLFKLLHRTPGFNPDGRRRLQMALDVARGMNFLHTCRPPIIHRDLKSPNLLVDKDMSVKVCDFGLSRVRHATILSAKSQAGTPEWTAPEVLQSHPCSEASDVYSFGVILWELMTGEEPWEDKTAMQVVGCVGFNNERLPVPTNIDKSIQDLMTACFGDAKDRPTFSEIISVLKKRVSEMNALAAANRSKSDDAL